MTFREFGDDFTMVTSKVRRCVPPPAGMGSCSSRPDPASATTPTPAGTGGDAAGRCFLCLLPHSSSCIGSWLPCCVTVTVTPSPPHPCRQRLPAGVPAQGVLLPARLCAHRELLPHLPEPGVGQLPGLHAGGDRLRRQRALAGRQAAHAGPRHPPPPRRGLEGPACRDDHHLGALARLRGIRTAVPCFCLQMVCVARGGMSFCSVGSCTRCSRTLTHRAEHACVPELSREDQGALLTTSAHSAACVRPSPCCTLSATCTRDDADLLTAGAGLVCVPPCKCV